MGSDKGQEEAPPVLEERLAGPQTPETDPAVPAGAAKRFQPDGESSSGPHWDASWKGASSTKIQGQRLPLGEATLQAFVPVVMGWAVCTPTAPDSHRAREASREGCRSPPIPAGPQRLGASLAISSGLPAKR